MLNYTRKKKNNLSAYKAIRENIQLNKNNDLSEGLSTHLNYENVVSQMTEINLITPFNSHKKGQSDKLLVRWWEN